MIRESRNESRLFHIGRTLGATILLLTVASIGSAIDGEAVALGKGSSNTLKRVGPLDMERDDDGNAVVIGFAIGANGRDERSVAKYSPSGSELWRARFPRQGKSEAVARGLAVDQFGGVYVTGIYIEQVEGSAARTSFIFKYDNDGNALYSKIGKGVGGVDIALDSDGNAIVLGQRFEAGSDVEFATLTKLDPRGNEIWVTSIDRIGALSVDSEGVILVDCQRVGDSGRVYSVANSKERGGLVRK